MQETGRGDEQQDQGVKGNITNEDERETENFQAEDVKVRHNI
jgi:hypothetical protein